MGVIPKPRVAPKEWDKREDERPRAQTQMWEPRADEDEFQKGRQRSMTLVQER
jgi:hypothetical protein